MSALSQVEDELRLRDAFSAWAGVYDQQPNPLLALEERYLLRLLPKIEGRDILDVGCGTGRWLALLAKLNPKSLHGVDFSPEMLARAAERIPGARLSLARCNRLPIDDACADIALASFVLSYVDDMRSIAKELARVIRPSGDVILSDMHPETAARLHWKRSFSTGNASSELPAWHRHIQEIIDAFTEEGFIKCSLVEPIFGRVEEGIFAAHNKQERLAEAEHLPAIYLLHIAKPCTASGPQSLIPGGHLLYGAQCALGPREKAGASIITSAGKIEMMSSRHSSGMTPSGVSIDLSGYLLFPGLVNAHDHLEFALFPKLGRGPYQNATQWAQDIQQNDAEVIALHRRIPKRTRLWWGGIRNLLSGVTTVCHHNPIDPCVVRQDFPVRVIAHFGWEHSLAFTSDVKAAHNQTPEDQPFIIHACEGIEEESRQELRTLDELGVLGQRTVLVHGLAFGREEATLLNDRGSSLITCPSSNHFLFGKTPSREVLDSVNRLALGSDSPLTAAGDLLDEIRFVHSCAMTPQRLYSLVTDAPSSILRMEGAGTIRPGCPADLIAVLERDGEPADILCSLSANDIELVVLEGRVQLASESIFNRLSQKDREGLETLAVDGNVRWLRAPIDDLLREAEDVLGEGQVCLGGRSLCRP